MNEFEFDKESANRISKVVQMYPMSLSDCADILETVAPLCSIWTPKGFKQRIHDVFPYASNFTEDEQKLIMGILDADSDCTGINIFDLVDKHNS